MAIEINEGRGIGENKDHIHLHINHMYPKITYYVEEGQGQANKSLMMKT